jgi:hypothetical protein
MAGFDEHLAILALLPAQVEAAAVQAVDAALNVPFEESQDIVPVRTGLLRSTGLVQVEADGAGAVGRISYGNEETLRHGAGRPLAGFGAPKGHPERQIGPIWEDIGYEIFVHEGVFDSATGTHPPRKFLELPVLNSIPEMEEVMATRFKEAFED